LPADYLIRFYQQPYCAPRAFIDLHNTLDFQPGDKYRSEMNCIFQTYNFIALYNKEKIMITSRLLSGLLFAALAIVIAGCRPPAAKEQNPSTPPVLQTKEQPVDAGASKDTAETSTKSLPGLAELSVEDRQLAEKQHVCPVSGEVLGSMGKPYKVSAEGKTVFLCCEGCLQQFKDNPEKYLAKIKNNDK
jgi:YHS domain-containing protein